MSQKITIQINGREYMMTASSQEEEEIIRKAASTINDHLNVFLSKYQGRQVADILAFIALNSEMDSIRKDKRIAGITSQIEILEKLSSGYLERIEKSSR